MNKSRKSQGIKGKGSNPITEEVLILEGQVKLIRTVKGGDFWTMSTWIRQAKKYYRKSLRTRILDEAKALAIEEYFQLQSKIRSGEPVFSIDSTELVERYLAHQKGRMREYGKHEGGITEGRYNTIRSILNKHFLGFVGEKRRLDTIREDDFYEYYKYRWGKSGDVKLATLRNERSVLGNLFGFAVRENMLPKGWSPSFDILPRNTQKYSSREDRRDSFNQDEWKKIYTYLKIWVKDVRDPRVQYERRYIRDFILIAANSGLRFGELRKLKWNMVQLWKGDERRVNARIEVPFNTKTGARTVQAQRGDIFQRIKGYSKYTGKNDWIFVDNDLGTPINKKVYYKLWHEILDETELRLKGKKFTYYSLRHTYCTFRLLGGVDVFDLALNMGTSVKHIEDHYGHVKTDMKRSELTKRWKQDESMLAFID